MKPRTVLVLGATGYVGQRLVRLLADTNFRVKASWRSPAKFQRCSWSKDSRVQPVHVDVLVPDTLQQALSGCSTAYYLIHSLYSGKQYVQLDRDAASNMIEVAEKVGLERIIYLGGLLDRRDRLSKHLLSRAEVSRILQSGSVPVTTLRAAMLLGAGSASFEIMRYVVERLPIMITPRWAQSKTQPIAISNTLTYLLKCLTVRETIGKTFDIGGPEVLRYPDLIQIFAQEANLAKRSLIPVPFLGNKFSTFLIDKVTPIPQSLARPLIKGLQSETICRDKRILELIPQRLLTNRETIRFALQEIDYQFRKSRFSKDESRFIPEWTQPNDPPWAGGTNYFNQRKVIVNCSPEELWKPVIQIGGPQGWYYANWLWRIYGGFDEFIGGVGIRRGRVDCDNLCPGDAVDCWKTIAVDPPHYLKLEVETRIPARSTLEFIIRRIDDEKSELRQIITYKPNGLLGIAYWKLTFPIHLHIWNNMCRKIAESIRKDILT